MASASYDDVADLYDAVVPFDLDLPFLLDVARDGGQVLELAAGTGRVSLPLVRAGADVVCVDGSRPMLDVLDAKLRAEGRTAELVHADVRDLDLGRTFPRVLFPFHAVHELVLTEDRARMLAVVRRHVAPGGRFVCALHNETVRAAALDGVEGVVGSGEDPDGRFVELRGRYALDDGTGLVTGEQTWVVDGVPRATIPIRFVLLPPETFGAEARAAGFEVDDVYGDYERSPFDGARSPHAVFVLR